MIAYYRSKGYEAQYGKEIEIDIKDLQEKSNALVNCNCDYCNKIMQIPYKKYTSVMSSKVPKIACIDCIDSKREDCVMATYGVKNVFELEETKNKIIQYYLDNFGVQYYTQTEEYKEKAISTNLQKYGTKNPSQNEDIKKAIINTCWQKYGFKSPKQSNIVKEKCRNNLLSKYGVPYAIEIPGVREKMALTLYKNQTVATSRQQKYIHSLFGGELNGVVSYYNCDIVLREEKVVWEIDFSGHDLLVKLGKLSREEFKQKEIVRNNQIKREGYRIVRIISRKDYLPSDEILLQMLQYARDFFEQNPKRTWLSFDIDKSCIYNAYHKETDVDNIQYYNYGKLHKIYKE